MKGKIIKGIIITIVIAAIGTGSYFGYNKFFKKTTTSTASNNYTISKATTMDLSKTIDGSGSAYSGTTSDVSASNSGTISGLSVKVGDKVTKGQTLFVCTNADLAKAVTNATRSLTKAQAQLTADKASLAAAKAQLAVDKAAQVVDETKITQDEAAITSYKNKVTDDTYSVEEAKDTLATAKEAVSAQTVTAPVSGTITAVNNSNGDKLQNGGTVISIADLSDMLVNVSVDELDISTVEVGQSANITFDAIDDTTFTGKVVSIAETGSTNNSVTTYSVAVSIDSAKGIKLGMNANVTIAIESKDNALVIPEEALIESNSKKYVRVVTSTTTVSKDTVVSELVSSSKLVEITTGLETEDYIEVLTGVTADETIIVQLPSSSTSTQSGFGMGGMMGGFSGGQRPDGAQGGPPSGSSGGSGTKSN